MKICLTKEQVQKLKSISYDAGMQHDKNAKMFDDPKARFLDTDFLNTEIKLGTGVKYDFGQSLYLKTDLDQKERILIKYQVIYGGTILYGLAYEDVITWHYDIEISEEKDIVKSTSN